MPVLEIQRSTQSWCWMSGFLQQLSLSDGKSLILLLSHCRSIFWTLQRVPWILWVVSAVHSGNSNHVRWTEIHRTPYHLTMFCFPLTWPVLIFSLVQICKIISYAQCAQMGIAAHSQNLYKSAPVQGEHLIIGFSNKTILSVKITWKIYNYITCLHYVHFHKFIKNPIDTRPLSQNNIWNCITDQNSIHSVEMTSSSLIHQIVQCQIWCQWSDIGLFSRHFRRWSWLILNFEQGLQMDSHLLSAGIGMLGAVLADPVTGWFGQDTWGGGFTEFSSGIDLLTIFKILLSCRLNWEYIDNLDIVMHFLQLSLVEGRKRLLLAGVIWFLCRLRTARCIAVLAPVATGVQILSCMVVFEIVDRLASWLCGTSLNSTTFWLEQLFLCPLL